MHRGARNSSSFSLLSLLNGKHEHFYYRTQTFLFIVLFSFQVMTLNQRTIAEIRSYTKPVKEIHIVMQATLVLLGNPSEETKVEYAKFSLSKEKIHFLSLLDAF